MADVEYNPEFLDPEVENLLNNGIEAVSDEVAVLDEDSGTVSCMFRLNSTEGVDSPYEQFGDLLEKEGYQRGERLGFESYSAELDPQGIRTALKQPYVEAAELGRVMRTRTKSQ